MTYVDKVVSILNEMFDTPPNENPWNSKEEFLNDFKEKITEEYDVEVQKQAGGKSRGRPRKDLGV